MEKTTQDTTQAEAVQSANVVKPVVTFKFNDLKESDSNFAEKIEIVLMTSLKSDKIKTACDYFANLPEAWINENSDIAYSGLHVRYCEDVVTVKLVDIYSEAKRILEAINAFVPKSTPTAKTVLPTLRPTVK